MRRHPLLVLAWIFFLGFVVASEPTVPDKNREARSLIEGLRYTRTDDEQATGTKLRMNFSRDCDGFAYNAKDKDLMVREILQTFPPKAIRDYLKTNLSQCPYTVREALDILEIKLGIDEARGAAEAYLTSFESFGTYSWGSHMWNLRPILKRVGCGQTGVRAFSHIYCGYSSLEQISYIREEFLIRCPGTEPKCAQNPQRTRKRK